MVYRRRGTLGDRLEDAGVFLYDLLLLILRTLHPFMLRDEITGEELLEYSGPLIVASNHVGWMEMLLIIATLWPRRVHYMAKRELYERPAAAWALRGLRTFPINREHPALSEWKTAIRLLRNGGCVGVLASGTRGGQQAKQGAARLALASGARLITARYEGPPSPKARHLFIRPHATLHFELALEGRQNEPGSTRARSRDLTNRIDESIHGQRS